MTKITVFLYYWLTLASVLLAAKYVGIADKDSDVVKLVVAVTMLYAAIIFITLKRVEDKNAGSSEVGKINKSGKKFQGGSNHSRANKNKKHPKNT